MLVRVITFDYCIMVVVAVVGGQTVCVCVCIYVCGSCLLQLTRDTHTSRSEYIQNRAHLVPANLYNYYRTSE